MASRFIKPDSGNTLVFTEEGGNAALTIDTDGHTTLYYQLQGGIGAHSTGGVTDWNDISNAISGSGRSLLLGSASNGPGGSDYFHSFTFEYNYKNGSGNMTQTAWAYNSNNRYMRWKYSGTWSSWYSF